ncbi:MAG: LptE family protein [Bacteroidales bacterium]|nr:LptE family protein [Bacteroidales bacterium]
MKQKIKLLFFILFSTSLLSSCITYSFTGASIPPSAKTISISYFENNADFINPTLSETLTSALKDRFTSQSSLTLIPSGGDLQFEGQITNYKTSPQAIQGDDFAALTRLTVTVKIKFTNLIEPENNFETSFTAYEDYNSELDLVTVQDGLIETIKEMLIDDIFNKAVVNW